MGSVCVSPPGPRPWSHTRLLWRSRLVCASSVVLCGCAVPACCRAGVCCAVCWGQPWLSVSPGQGVGALWCHPSPWGHCPQHQPGWDSEGLRPSPHSPSPPWGAQQEGTPVLGTVRAPRAAEIPWISEPAPLSSLSPSPAPSKGSLLPCLGAPHRRDPSPLPKSWFFARAVPASLRAMPAAPPPLLGSPGPCPVC